MGSRPNPARITAAIRALLLFGAGAAAAAAWHDALYASATLALLIAGWALMAASRTDPVALPLPPPPPPPSDDASERRKLSAYLNLTPAPLVTLGANGRAHAANRAARRLFDTDDLIADTDDRLARSIADTAPGKSASVALSMGGAQRSFAIATADLAIAGAATRTAVLIDIEGELRAAEATALREMLQVLGHELRNTLTPIASLGQSAVDMLRDAAPDLAQVQDAVATIARRAAGLQRFSQGYAALARLPAPNRTRTDLHRMTGDLDRLFRTHWPDIALTGATGDPAIAVAVDADQLSAALWALLQNGAEAVAAAPDPQVSLRVTQTAAGVQFEVNDNGPGVPRANRDAVFRPFFTTKAAGSGIGLALARQIFQAHGGTLDLDEEEGSGGRFIATIAAPI